MEDISIREADWASGRRLGLGSADLVGFEDALIRDDPSDESRRCHVERWVPHLHSGRSRTGALPGRNLVCLSLLDGDCGTVRSCEIDGGGRCSNIEWYAVRLGGEGETIGTDFVGDISIGCDAVRPHDDAGDITQP